MVNFVFSNSWEMFFSLFTYSYFILITLVTLLVHIDNEKYILEFSIYFDSFTHIMHYFHMHPHYAFILLPRQLNPIFTACSLFIFMSYFFDPPTLIRVSVRCRQLKWSGRLNRNCCNSREFIHQGQVLTKQDGINKGFEPLTQISVPPLSQLQVNLSIEMQKLETLEGNNNGYL